MLIFGLIVRGENHGLAVGLETNWLTPETLGPSQFSTRSRHFGTETGSVVKPSCISSLLMHIIS